MTHQDSHDHDHDHEVSSHAGRQITLKPKSANVVVPEHVHTAECTHDHGHEHEDEHDHGHDHSGHNHGEHEHHHAHAEPPAFLPEWMKAKWMWWQLVIAGLSLFIGWYFSKLTGAMHYVSIPFYAFSLYLTWLEMAKIAFTELKEGHLDIDLLMVVAALGAVIIREWFEAGLLMLLFGIGHAAEDMILEKAREGISKLAQLMPKLANVFRNGQYHEVVVEDVLVGDRVQIKVGEVVPVDGQVVSGKSTVNQSHLTGESMPVEKRTGDEILAGSQNMSGVLEVVVAKEAKDSTLGQVIELVEQAQRNQGPRQLRVSKFTKVFVPAVLIFAVLVAVVPPIAGWLTIAESFYKALFVLVAASPCALAIGTPAASISAIARAARAGVIIKGGYYLEPLGDKRMEVVVLDKTGTVTEADFKVRTVLAFNGFTEAFLLQIVGAVEKWSEHPIALAISRYCVDQKIEFLTAEGLEEIEGRGVKSTIQGKDVFVGSLKLFKQLPAYASQVSVVESTVLKLQGSGHNVVVVGFDDKIVGILGLADAPRAGVQSLVQRLYAVGLKHIVMLTGDNPEVAGIIAKQLNITEVHAGLLPADKLRIIREIDEAYDMLIFVGDGTNDAPALAGTHVGIAVAGTATEVALQTADVVLMNGDINKLPFVIGLAKASQRIITQNLAIAFGVIAILIIATLVTSLPLGLAVTLHEGSTVLVALNAVRLLGYRGPKIS